MSVECGDRNDRGAVRHVYLAVLFDRGSESSGDITGRQELIVVFVEKTKESSKQTSQSGQ